ncbi:LysM peptidoglycan-binding domain-containing protein [Pedobacter sp. HMF7647]|uniref:Peptidoglycan hydrolase n=1 Tax=Hufsiella arboris TaxID=2695275 RepID=A0A7K1Y5I4_9SPHI|nr:glucosaminidase domain-containing protein [Hufsiella arboris]MXV49854.1 LysM peptidoglycan-binding domain-containing protein [Hufsiella arboris]
MKRSVCFLLGCVAFASCSSKKVLVKNSASPQKPQQVITDNVLVKKYPTAVDYINRFKAIAVAEMNQYGIPASITLAQGLLESGNGNGTLARVANNHFGIKCNTNWKGKTILQDDDQLGECFRVYNTPEESFRDHSIFLQRKRYASLFQLDKNDYQGWAYGLKQAGYATNPQYPQLLINLIDRYQLTQYDRPDAPADKSVREEKVLTAISQTTPAEQKKEPEKAPVTMKIYEVRSGDTLYNISKRFSISVDDLKILNNIQGADIKLGQLLLVSK